MRIFFDALWYFGTIERLFISAGQGADVRVVKQTSLFTDAAADDKSIALGIPGSAPTLSHAQKQFNKLVAEIAALRKRLAAWQDYPAQYQQRISAEVDPLRARLRQASMAMAALLDGAICGKGLTRRERDNARDLLSNLVFDLSAEGTNPALDALAARHGFGVQEDDGSGELDMLEALGSEIFGVELDAGHGAASPEELARLFADKVEAERFGRHAGRTRRPHKKSAKAQEREAWAERTAKDASQALRDVYRKLARDLHPDRIGDEQERARKTGLMQEANSAYQARDLLALLELQWRIEQIDPAHMANLAEEKLGHFNHVLTDQVQSLRDEIDSYVMPFMIHFERKPPRDLQPMHVERELGRQISGMQATLRELQADLHRYANLAELKRDLRDYSDTPFDLEFNALISELGRELSMPRRRKRRR